MKVPRVEHASPSPPLTNSPHLLTHPLTHRHTPTHPPLTHTHNQPILNPLLFPALRMRHHLHNQTVGQVPLKFPSHHKLSLLCCVRSQLSTQTALTMCWLLAPTFNLPSHLQFGGNNKTFGRVSLKLQFHQKPLLLQPLSVRSQPPTQTALTMCWLLALTCTITASMDESLHVSSRFITTLLHHTTQC